MHDWPLTISTYDFTSSDKQKLLTIRIPAAAQYLVNDPLYTVPAMAAGTRNLDFGITASTTYDKPYGF